MAATIAQLVERQRVHGTSLAPSPSDAPRECEREDRPIVINAADSTLREVAD